jgi:hypothetical protein
MTHSALTTRNLGLAIFGLLSLGDIATLALTDGQAPPYAVAVLSALLGAVSLVLVIQASRDPGRSLRLLIGLRVLAAVTAMPAFFVDAPAGAQAAAGAIVVLTAAGVVLTARASQPAVA